MSANVREVSKMLLAVMIANLLLILHFIAKSDIRSMLSGHSITSAGDSSRVRVNSSYLGSTGTKRKA